VDDRDRKVSTSWKRSPEPKRRNPAENASILHLIRRPSALQKFADLEWRRASARRARIRESSLQQVRGAGEAKSSRTPPSSPQPPWVLAH